MARYYAVEGVDVVHILYNLCSVSLESLAWVPLLKLGQHRLRLVTQSNPDPGMCTQCSYSGAATMGASSYIECQEAHGAKGSGQS